MRSSAPLGCPTTGGARTPLIHGLNIPAWRENRHKFVDHQLVDFLDFGFPTGFQGFDIPTLNLPNHSSSTANPSHFSAYIATELRHNALAGPFRDQPFKEWFRTNPMLTRPKRDSNKLRVILDLSFPDTSSVNSAIPRVSLDNAPFKLRIPTVQDFAATIATLGQGCSLYKIDLSRAYRQLRSDPLDWALLGVAWDDHWYMDVAIPFGLRHGASACQRVTESVIEMVSHDVQALAHAYIDDTVGAAIPLEAPLHYSTFIDTMQHLGLDSAPEKCQPPTTRLTWIGATFAMTMSIDMARVHEAIEKCNEFLGRTTVTRKYMEKLLGKIFHAIKCTDGARRFTSRLLALLSRTAYGTHTVIDETALADARWLATFLPSYNGCNIIKPTTAQLVVEVDACPTGAGGYTPSIGYYHLAFPHSIASLQLNIASLECLNNLFAARLWIQHRRGLVVLLFCDNAASVCAINSGRACDPLIQSVIRDLWMLCAINDVTLVARHKPGSLMTIPDALSHLMHPKTHSPAFADIVAQLTEPQSFMLLPPCVI